MMIGALRNNPGAPDAATDAPDARTYAKAKPKSKKRKIRQVERVNEDDALRKQCRRQEEREQRPSPSSGDNVHEKTGRLESALPLKGKIVALSSALSKAERRNSTNVEEEERTNASMNARGEVLTPTYQPSYQDLAILCHSAGAEVTAMVHRRVFCLIVTDAAAKQNTQKIRKARKYGVPIVKVAWLRDCLAQRKVVPFELVEVPSRMSWISSTTNAGLVKLQSTAPEEEGRTVDLGCCCACHELGTTSTCQWCVDCST
jgi:twin BRCT domain